MLNMDLLLSDTLSGHGLHLKPTNARRKTNKHKEKEKKKRRIKNMCPEKNHGFVRKTWFCEIVFLAMGIYSVSTEHDGVFRAICLKGPNSSNIFGKNGRPKLFKVLATFAKRLSAVALFGCVSKSLVPQNGTAQLMVPCKTQTHTIQRTQHHSSCEKVGIMLACLVRYCTRQQSDSVHIHKPLQTPCIHRCCSPLTTQSLQSWQAQWLS